MGAPKKNGFFSRLKPKSDRQVEPVGPEDRYPVKDDGYAEDEGREHYGDHGNDGDEKPISTSSSRRSRRSHRQASDRDGQPAPPAPSSPRYHYRKNGVVSRDTHEGVLKAAALARKPTSFRANGPPTSTRSQGQLRATKSQGQMRPARSSSGLKATKSQGQLPSTRPLGQTSSFRQQGNGPRASSPSSTRHQQPASARPLGRSNSGRRGQSPNRRPLGPASSARELGRGNRNEQRPSSRGPPRRGQSPGRPMPPEQRRSHREQGRRSPAQIGRKHSSRENGHRKPSFHANGSPKQQMPPPQQKRRPEEYTAEERRMLEHALQHYRNGNELCREEFFDEAILEYKKAVLIREPIVGKYHLDTASLYWYIGNCYYAKGDYDNALMSHHRWLRIRRHLNEDVNKPGIMWIIGPLQKKGLSDEQIKQYDENLKTSLLREREGDELRDKREFKRAILKYKEAISYEKACFDNGLNFDFGCPQHGVHHPCP